MRVVVVLQDVAREIDRAAARIVQLDPIARRAAARFDFVDLHRIRAVVRGAVRRARGDDERARTIRATAERRRRVRGPAPLVDFKQERVVETHRIRSAESEAVRAGVREHDEVAAGRDRRARAERLRVGVVVVLHDPAGEIDGGARRIEDLDPVVRVAVRFDLVDDDRRRIRHGQHGALTRLRVDRRDDLHRTSLQSLHDTVRIDARDVGQRTSST